MPAHPLDLAGKTVLVTGASSGIGRDASVLLGELGARVVLSGRDTARLESTRGQMKGDGHATAPLDLEDIEKIPEWMLGLAREHGPLHGLVHCAGITATMPVRFQPFAEVDRIMRTNWATAWGLAKGFRQKQVRAGGDARIVFISSVMGVVGQPGIAAYASSKGAMLALAKSLAMEFSSEAIRVNCVVAGHVKTEMAEKLESSLTAEQFEAIKRMHPLGIGTSRDVSYAVAFLLADTGRWITGSELVVDGGYTAH